jgi:hypothetical protein
MGATLVPNTVPSTPPGEVKLFEDLANDPGATGWVVLHSLDLANHVERVQGEADFVILIPGEGVIVLEVKSHNFIKFDEGLWYLGNDPKPERRGPVKQGSQAMHSILKFLKHSGFSTIGIPFVSAVAFTAVPFTTKSPEWHSWQILDLQALNARSISENLLHVIREGRKKYKSSGATHSFNSDEVAKLKQMLRPRFEFHGSPANAIKLMNQSLIRSTEEQYRILNRLDGAERILVNGLAGTGKTTLAVEILRRKMEVEPRPTAALFCYNNLLGNYLRNDTNSLQLCGNLKVGTFHQWLREFTGHQPTALQASNQDYWDYELPNIAMEALLEADIPGGIWDFLVLDEAQDLFREPFLDIFNYLLKGGLSKGLWYFFGDFDHQDIFAHASVPLEAKRGEEGGKVFKRDYATLGYTPFLLDINCRNTLEISTAITQHTGLSPGYFQTLRGDFRHDPEIHFYSNDTEQKSLATHALERLRDLGFKPAEIIFLSPLGDHSLASSMDTAGPLMGRIEVIPGTGKHFSRSTIHAFKGLEKQAVIVTDIGALPIDPRAMKDLLYIGMSRALHSLHVFVKDQYKNNLLKPI